MYLIEIPKCKNLKDGKTVFVPYSLPDEVLEISIVKEHKNYTEGKIEKILEASPHRVEPRCPYFYVCGGCNLQTADDKYQHFLRKRYNVCCQTNISHLPTAARPAYININRVL